MCLKDQLKSGRLPDGWNVRCKRKNKLDTCGRTSALKSIDLNSNSTLPLTSREILSKILSSSFFLGVYCIFLIALLRGLNRTLSVQECGA